MDSLQLAEQLHEILSNYPHNFSSKDIFSLLTKIFLCIQPENMNHEDHQRNFHLQSEEEALAPYPSVHSCFVCNIVAFFSIFLEGSSSRFIQRGVIPAVYLSCAMNYEIDQLQNGDTTLLSYEPVVDDDQELCHKEASQYPEVSFSLDPTFQSDWFSYFVHYFEMIEIYNVWKGHKFIESYMNYPTQLQRGMSIVGNVTFQKTSFHSFSEHLQTQNPENQIGCVVVFRKIDPRYELFGMWFSWVLIDNVLFIVDIQNSRISKSLDDAVEILGWEEEPHSEVFYGNFKKSLYVIPRHLSNGVEVREGTRDPEIATTNSLIPSHHRKLIHNILHRTSLVRNFSSSRATKTYRIVELEYYYSSLSHPDPYVHLDPHQSFWLCWYFHRQNGKSYKGGTYKGLDISIGDIGSPIDHPGKENKGAGGLLIRSIMNIETGEVIQGPCKVVNELLHQPNSDSLSVHDLVSELQNSALSDSLPVRIESQNTLTFQRIKSNGHMILRSPRVGLTFRRVSPIQGRDYLMAPYRYTYSNIDYKANKALLSILKSNLNKFSPRKFNISASQDWLRSYKEGVTHRTEDKNRDAINHNHQAFQRRMSQYCTMDWKVADLCYLYGYLIDSTAITEMVDYDVERNEQLIEEPGE